MKPERRSKFWQRPLAPAILVIILFLLMVTAVSANSINEQLMWVTVCHHPPGHPEQPQTMIVYWSILDQCLSYFGDTIGSCTYLAVP